MSGKGTNEDKIKALNKLKGDKLLSEDTQKLLASNEDAGVILESLQGSIDEGSSLNYLSMAQGKSASDGNYGGPAEDTSYLMAQLLTKIDTLITVTRSK